MILLKNAELTAICKPVELIDALEFAFAHPFESPERMHCDLPGEDAAKLLIMPAWQSREAIGVKVATVMPLNSRSGLPTIDGVYILLDGRTGAVEAILDAPALTALRTSAISALASRRMSRPDATTLLIVGTGALAPHLARAHASVRNFHHIKIWGRSNEKAENVVRQLGDIGCSVSVVDDIEAATRSADVVSCATLSDKPLIDAAWVTPGTHLDFVGSFTPQMREADPAILRTARLVVDTLTALKESGDLIEPASLGFIQQPPPELSDIVRGQAPARLNDREITMFKSVGTGLSDIAAARYLVRKALTKAPETLANSASATENA